MNRSVAAFLFPLIVAGATRGADPDNCLLCHQFRGLTRFDRSENRLHVYFVDPEYHRSLGGPHARLACTDCHPRESVGVIPHRPVEPVNCTRTCHLVTPGGMEQRFSHAGIAEALSRSVHSGEVFERLRFSGGPLLGREQSHCLYCHDEPLFREPVSGRSRLRAAGDGALDRCQTCHQDQLSTDIRYYMKHIASRLQPARSILEVAQVCAICHSDPMVRDDFGMTDAVASFVRSFHGKAALLGSMETADCLDCHSAGRGQVHVLLGKSDPASAVHPARIADSCTTIECHPGANPRISSASVHLDLPTTRGSLEFLLAAAFILVTLATFGPSALLALLELLQMVVGREHHGDREILELTKRVAAHPVGRKRLVRFTVPQRIQHWILAILFTLLALTGFPMKFADAGWSGTVIGWFGGLESARLIHRWAGIGLMVGFVGHLVHIFFNVVRRARASEVGGAAGLWRTFVALPMWMTLEDGRKALQLFAYLCFLRNDRPTFGKFSVKEKFEYIGVFWGTVILGVSGLLLWGAELASHVVSGRLLNLALIAHTYEAYLAVIHVGILHIYAVMLSPQVFPLSPATLTGGTPVAELAENHSEFVREIASQLELHREASI